MSTPGGNTQIFPHTVPAPAATVTAARNGLSLVGTFVELGLNPLIHDTIVNTTPAFTFRLGSVGVAAAMFLTIKGGNEGWLGDWANQGNGTRLHVFDSNQVISGEMGGFEYLVLDKQNDVYQIGDIQGSGNQTFLFLNNIAKSITANSAANISLNLDEASRLYEIGSLGLGNTTKLSVLDGTKNVRATTGALKRMLDLENVNFTYQIGDLDSLSNGTLIKIDAAANSIQLKDGSLTGSAIGWVFTLQNTVTGRGTWAAPPAGGLTAANNGLSVVGTTVKLGGSNLLAATDIPQNNFKFTHSSSAKNILLLDPANNLYQIGDINGITNGTFISINDATQQIFLKDGSLAGSAIGYAYTLQDTATGRAAWAAIPAAAVKDYTISVYQALGSTIKAQTFGINLGQLTLTGTALGNQLIEFIPVWLAQGGNITGVKWWQFANGAYSANNYNGVGLYSYAGGTLTLVASSVNDANVWSQGAGAMRNKDFSAVYNAAAGLYFVALLLCYSAVTTSPTTSCAALLGSATFNSGDFTNSALLFCDLAAQTALPGSQAMSGLTAYTTRRFVAIY